LKRSALLVVGAALAVAASTTVSPAGAQQTAGRHQDPGSRARALVAQLTLDEKIEEMHGIQNAEHLRYVPGIPRLGIPPLVITNGPAGVGPGDAHTQAPATALPAPIALAASFDANAARRYGRIVGGEAGDLGNGFVEGPDVDIMRVPQNGRTFEGFGEDPYLDGQIAADDIAAAQSQGIIAEAKHFTANNQETNRFAVDESIDERTLQEIYLAPYQTVITQGRADAVMCAYPQINGTFNCQNDQLLAGVLRGRFGFTGMTTSDFGATHSTVGSIDAGLDLEMPTGIYFDTALKTAVQDGQVSMATLDNALVTRFTVMIRAGLFDHPPLVKPIPAQADGAQARTLAEDGMVLLKNDAASVGGASAQNRRHSTSLLPLSGTALRSVAVIGPYAGAAKTGGGGSSHVVPLYTVAPVAGIQSRVGPSVSVTYNDGSDLTTAAAAAKSADVAIVMVGDAETEGKDRPNLSLAGNQDALVEAVAAANPRTVVVLKTGARVLMPWVNQVPAILEAWYPGEEDGNAVAAVLFGDVDPSGKLPVTFPVAAGDVPASTPAQYPGVNGTATYSEGVFVGYRHYDEAGITPLFPFGFGLSYTTFKFSDLSVCAGPDGRVTVTAEVRNTGRRAGAEVAQLYVGDPSSAAAPEPPNQLQGFTKVELGPGQGTRVTFTLSARSFSYWDTAANSWRVAGGAYHIRLGDSSRDLPLTATVHLAAR
jgi:beta-glucosidase